ncbi:MetS family NSS transporter small subunit [Thermosediminibacter litoriperuensis]|nr:MetS family NSS transporter small subunit [Thermosediminibacter litoriperuensis]
MGIKVGSLITMVLILGMVWGGLAYFLNLAFRAQQK